MNLSVHSQESIFCMWQNQIHEEYLETDAQGVKTGGRIKKIIKFKWKFDF